MKQIALGAIALGVLLFGFSWSSTLMNQRSATVPDQAEIEPKDITTTPVAPAPNVMQQTPEPKIEKRTTIETEPISFESRSVDDSSLAKGKTSVKTKGTEGLKTLTYEVTLTDGAQTDRRLIDEVVTRAPVAEVILVGTKSVNSSMNGNSLPAGGQSGCDPNYSGACVPIDSDVDCAGGSGNGPSYVKGPVTVIGVDIYKLDSDHDGVGCE